MGSTGLHCADELKCHEGKPTKRGLVMLEEIWIALGRPAKPEDDDDTIDMMVAIDNIPSHQGQGNRAAIGRVRNNLMQCGYLHMEEYMSDEDMEHLRPGWITQIGLSGDAYDALIDAGILKFS